VEEDFSLSNGGINTVPKSLCAETKSYKRHEILLGLSPPSSVSIFLSFCFSRHWNNLKSQSSKQAISLLKAIVTASRIRCQASAFSLIDDIFLCHHNPWRVHHLNLVYLGTQICFWSYLISETGRPWRLWLIGFNIDWIFDIGVITSNSLGSRWEMISPPSYLTFYNKKYMNHAH
jgi:hypothetical protein